jgi:hypothetical protein
MPGSLLPPPLRCEGYWHSPQHQLPLLTIHFHRPIVRMQSVPKRSQALGGEFVHKAERGCGEIGAVLLEGQPVPVESLGRAAGGVLDGSFPP